MIPRIEPVRSLDAKQAEALAGVPTTAAGDPFNIFSTLAHHPALLKRFNAMGGVFSTRSMLTTRTREIAILRVAHRTACEYEWFQHARAARECGLTDSEIDAIADFGPESSFPWPRSEHLILAFTDDLLGSDTVADDLWAEMAAQSSASELLELLMLVGFYRMTAGFLNASQVQIDPM